MFKKVLSSKKYWMSTAYIGLGFIIIFSVIEHFMHYNGLAVASFINDKIANGNWIKYTVSRIVGGLLYGMIMAYYFELRKRKSNR
ncbi:hypothetical protein J8281_16120 [Aquimarina sp. U1-2]|uniref:hypothetical protein n=1 Tax=Aquimarina sp. U1-2 TaxID=2823141 RepID=UPI001AEC96F8|nr:hypothetical protein [Aquimarina sp. U1-2]MBP2833722.1 hypothetical protein [Aquimarina sp. U1-2]